MTLPRGFECAKIDWRCGSRERFDPEEIDECNIICVYRAISAPRFAVIAAERITDEENSRSLRELMFSARRGDLYRRKRLFTPTTRIYGEGDTSSEQYDFARGRPIRRSEAD